MRKFLVKVFLAVAIASFLIGKYHGMVVHHHGSVSSGSGHTSLSGRLDCKQLEQLWKEAGGDPSEAKMAASVAMAESSGVQDPPSNAQYNSNHVTDVGYWQINAGYHPSLATTDPYGNARAAVIISDNGQNWGPWVTYQHGAEVGLC